MAAASVNRLAEFAGATRFVWQDRNLRFVIVQIDPDYWHWLPPE